MTPSDTHTALDLAYIGRLQEKPPPFEPGEPHFWTDPHIASQMLAAHLDPTVDAASRRPETIARCVNWIITTARLQPGDRVLDLGCGPGLYAQRLAQAGLQVSGVDFSQNSIDYAIAQAQEKQLPIEYRCQNYLELADQALYTAALLIYGDLCPLSPAQRAKLLANVHTALKPGGWFVLDVTTPHLRREHGLKNSWYAAGQGFWKPGPHLVLEQGFAYGDDLYLDQYIVIESDGQISVYRNWFQDYTPETIQAELAAVGFEVESLWGDLTGKPLTPDSEWIGVVAKKSA
ncbi:MAG TPA: methyltransferase domain-containing protein [Anaerolineales bacterium]|nr:methyltransferase domain-containing protein [Anaerolineales bacterium]